MRTLLLIAAVTGTLSACDAYDRDLGPAPFFCGPTEPRCPMGYSCMTDPGGMEICIAADESISNSFECADDSAFEPNDMLDEASVTPVDAMKTYALDGLAICPANDKDTFALDMTTANGNIELIVTFDAVGVMLRGSILNAGGVPIATAAPVSGMPSAMRAYAQNLPTGRYHVQVASTSSMVGNNYKFTIAVTGQ